MYDKYILNMYIKMYIISVYIYIFNKIFKYLYSYIYIDYKYVYVAQHNILFNW